MKYVITGGAGHISKPLALQLLKAGHTVTVIGRDEKNLAELIGAGAKAAIGSVNDVAFLTKTFAGTDALYLMFPPDYSATNNLNDHFETVAGNYATAIKANGIKHAVVLSSMGAHLPEGAGPVSGIHHGEVILRQLKETNIRFLRPAYFYYNLLGSVGMVKQAGIIGSNFSLPAGRFPIADTSDIAAAAATQLLQLNFSGHTIQYVVSAETSTDELAAAIGTAIGKPDLQWILFTNEQLTDALLQAGLPPVMAKGYTDLGYVMQTGSMSEDYYSHPSVATGNVKPADFARVFAAVYNAG
ncbi:MAG: NAD(P)H-binding protein [Chitinophagaceae bacterium]